MAEDLIFNRGSIAAAHSMLKQSKMNYAEAKYKRNMGSNFCIFLRIGPHIDELSSTPTEIYLWNG